jgi:toxic protein SymE
VEGEESAGRMGCNPNDPLTTTNSTEELLMANANNKTAKDGSVRFLTVSAQRRPPSYPKSWPPQRKIGRRDLANAPWIRLTGRWLEDAGFEIASRIRVEVEPGRLVITPA